VFLSSSLWGLDTLFVVGQPLAKGVFLDRRSVAFSLAAPQHKIRIRWHKQGTTDSVSRLLPQGAISWRQIPTEHVGGLIEDGALGTILATEVIWTTHFLSGGKPRESNFSARPAKNAWKGTSSDIVAEAQPTESSDTLPVMVRMMATFTA